MAERDWQKDWELAKRATPGPWEYLEGDLIGANGKGLQCFTKIFPREWGPFWCNQNDPVFIAQAREALPYWLQRVRELEEENRRLKAVAEAAKSMSEAWGRMKPVYFYPCEEGSEQDEVQGQMIDAWLGLVDALASLEGGNT